MVHQHDPTQQVHNEELYDTSKPALDTRSRQQLLRTKMVFRAVWIKSTCSDGKRPPGGVERFTLHSLVPFTSWFLNFDPIHIHPDLGDLAVPSQNY